MTTFPSVPQPRATPAARPRRASESQPSSTEAGTRLSDFFQIPQILRARFRCMTSFTSPGHILYLRFLL